MFTFIPVILADGPPPHLLKRANREAGTAISTITRIAMSEAPGETGKPTRMLDSSLVHHYPASRRKRCLLHFHTSRHPIIQSFGSGRTGVTATLTRLMSLISLSGAYGRAPLESRCFSHTRRGPDGRVGAVSPDDAQEVPGRGKALRGLRARLQVLRPEGAGPHQATSITIISPPPPRISMLLFVVWWPMWQWISHFPGCRAVQMTS